MGKLSNDNTQPHSALFRASIPDGRIHVTILMYQGSDVNLIPMALVKKTQHTELYIPVCIIDPPCTYKCIFGNPWATCCQSVAMNVQMKNGQGLNLILHNIVWKISQQDIDSPTINGRIPESMGCDSCKLLQAACDHNHVYIDVPEKMRNDGNAEQDYQIIVATCGEFLIHNDGKIEEHGLEENDIYVQFGNDSPRKYRKSCYYD